MSGPKLMHITNDPKVIERINNRLNTIGKQNYFSIQIQSINTDIQNEISWVKNYVTETINKTVIQQDKTEYLHNSLLNIKNNYLAKLNSLLLSKAIIDENSSAEINNIIVSIIKELPRVKRELMRDILDKIDLIKKNLQKEEYEKQLKIQKEKINEYNNEESAAENRSKTIRTKIYDSIAYNDDVKNDVKNDNLSSEEQVLLNTIREGVSELKKMDILTHEDEKYIKMILEDLDNIDNEEKYSVSARKNILVSMATYYNILEKNISNSLSDAILKDAKKKQMSVQYQFLCDYLELEPQKNINNIKEDKLENIINDLTSKASDKAYRMYVEDTIGNIMKEYGYDSVASYNVGEDKKNTRIVFSNNDINICSSVSKDAVMIQVVGIGEDQPTKEEIHEQLEQQGALCSLYPQIKEKMKENNIHIINEDCAPISEDSVMNISISKMPSKRKKKSYNTGFGRNADTSRGFYEQYGRKVMHIDS